MKNIYIIGRPADLYRTQTFVKSVMDSYDRWNLSLSYFVCSCGVHPTPLLSFWKNICKLPIWSIELVFSFFQIIRSDYIYLPAMGLFQRKARCEFWWAQLLKKKIICEYYVSFYDTFILDRKIASPNSKQARKYIKMDQKMQKCFRVIYLNRTEAKRYSNIARIPLAQINYRIIPLTVKERTCGQLPYWNKINKVFSIVWWGTYIPLHGLDKLIQVINLLPRSLPVHLYILGNSEEKSMPYKKMIETLGLSSYITVKNDLTFLNEGLENFLVSHCDLAIGAFGNSEKARSVILNKSLEAVAMKLPLLTQHSEAFLEYFDANSLFYSANNVEAIKEKIQEVMKIPREEIYKTIEAAYNIYQNNFSLACTEINYNQLLKEL